MATFTINFIANYPGQYQVGYKTYNSLSYNTTLVEVTAVGSQSLTVEVPGNLYCASADITYDCYVVARCQNAGYPLDGDGIPLGAATFQVIMEQQTDPCQVQSFECIGYPIGTIVVANDGVSLCTDGTYTVTITEVTPGDEIEPASIEVTVTGGVAVSTEIIVAGAYLVAPLLSVTIPNCTHTVDMTCTLAPVVIDLELLTYDAITLHNSLTKNLTMGIGDVITLGVDATQAGIVVGYDGITGLEIGNAHCMECQTSVISNTAATGEGKLLYQTCWDIEGTGAAIRLHVQKILPGVAITLGCVIKESITILQGTLDVLPTSVESECV